MERQGQTGKNTLKWTSQYGSVVINTFDSYTVSDGMNEHGLAAHLLYLDNSDYGAVNPDKLGLSNLVWAQYMLDNFKTVDEALKSIDQYQILPTELRGKTWPIHLSLEDPSGDSAIIEYIDGKAVVHHGKQYTVMTNEPAYDIQLSNVKKYKLFGGNLPLPGDVDPLSRFVRAATFLKTLPKPQNYIEAAAGVLSVMRTVMVPFGAEDTSGGKAVDSWPTRWITLSDLTNKTYYFSSTTAPNIVWLDFKNLDFSKNGKVLMVDPKRVELIGEISKELK
jgi:choloylglycine hydrolase